MDMTAWRKLMRELAKYGDTEYKPDDRHVLYIGKYAERTIDQGYFYRVEYCERRLAPNTGYNGPHFMLAVVAREEVIYLSDLYPTVNTMLKQGETVA